MGGVQALKGWHGLMENLMPDQTPTPEQDRDERPQGSNPNEPRREKQVRETGRTQQVNSNQSARTGDVAQVDQDEVGQREQER
jgi:hypothetical protein